MSNAPRPPGWYLGLRYMQGEGFVACEAANLAPAQQGARFLFADEILLETQNWREVIANWWQGIAVDGCLILWVPDCRYLEIGAGLARVTLEELSHVLDEQVGWQLLESDLIDGHAFVVWQKRADARQLKTPWRKQPKHLLVARTGALGDALMASSALPYLKTEGWTISYIGRLPGLTVLRHDPHIDELILLADGQVPENELPFYWQAWAKRFDRFINLTHSVEGELLKHPGRADYWWSDAQRRALCGRSYLAQTHALAGVTGPYRVKFYPHEQEQALAEKFATRTGDFVLWSLRGSAVHKWWPYGAQAICQLLARTKLNFVLTGDSDAASLVNEILAAAKNYHGDTSRVQSCVGTHSIRQVMTLARYACLVVGPETGVLHAVSMEAVPKILLLSHSAASNIADDWIMTTALRPTSSCYPCHRLHYSHDWCPQDANTKAAACAASISVSQVVNAVLAVVQSANATSGVAA